MQVRKDCFGDDYCHNDLLDEQHTFVLSYSLWIGDLLPNSFLLSYHLLTDT